MAKGRRLRNAASSGSRDDAWLWAVAASAVDGIIGIDETGLVTLFNPACERIFEYLAADVIGQSVRLLLPDAFCDGQFPECLSNPGRLSLTGPDRRVQGRRRDGSVFPLHVSLRERRGGLRRMFVCSVHEGVARQAAELRFEQAQRMEALGQLSGGIAHDFNNLLTVIIGNAETLSLKLAGQPDLRLLSDAIFTASERGAELTRQLLAFGRRQSPQPAAIDCGELLLELRRLLARTLRDDITFSISVPGDFPLVLANRTQVESAILNLVLNAQDAMPRGGEIAVKGCVTRLDVDGVVAGDYAQISVADTGVGMVPDTVARAFEPFFTTKAFGRGSGLGLSMVYGFVRESNGHVAIESVPGSGTTVRLYLPVAQGAHDAPSPEQRPAPKVALRGRETILVVEDDAHVREYILSLLDRLGYDVLTADSGGDALHQMKCGARPDLLFSDVVMPGITGWELAAQAQTIDPHLRVLLTSGYPPEAVRPGDGMAPHVQILQKPYRKSELLQHIRKVLDGRAPV
jgi:PAS domain S-box-containing protein